jgi:hypothetical protein
MTSTLDPDLEAGTVVDRNGLDVLTRAECLVRLREASVARVGLTLNALPVVLPVNIALITPVDGGEPVVVIRSVEGTKVRAALDKAVIAIETDDIDPISHSGWSVLVQGRSEVVTDPVRIDALGLRDVQLRPWASDAADVFIVVSTDVVSGRVVDPTHRARRSSPRSEP